MPSFVFKARMNSLFTLQINDLNLEVLQPAIRAHIAQNMQLFQAMPVVLDVPVTVAATGLDEFLRELLVFVRGEKMTPIACVNYSAVHQQFAEAAHLACLPVGASFALPVQDAPKRRDLVLEKPIRSGQQVYAAGDLIVMGSVSPGAELLADGNIHVFGALRGRALAGLRGESEARIFCQSLEAELISIAGIYQLYEHIPAELRKKPAHITLQNELLDYAPLKC